MIAMSHRALHPYAVCIAFAALSSAAWAQAPLHLETDAGWSHGAVSNAALDARLAAAALQYRSYAPVPRIAFFDLAYPKDSTEAAAMHGYAVLVVTAVGRAPPCFRCRTSTAGPSMGIAGCRSSPVWRLGCP